LLGGTAVRGGGLPDYPPRGIEEIRELLRVLEIGDGSLWTAVAGGSTHRELEGAFAAACGRKFAVAVNTGGMALRIALRAAGTAPGDEVLFQVNTCHAESFETIHAGAVPLWVDVDARTGGVDARSLDETLAGCERVKALVAIHTWGRPENLDLMRGAATAYGAILIEDCCLGLGAEWEGRPVGTFGKAAVCSFGYAKPLQAGEGGMIVTDDESFAFECRLLRGRGALWSLTGENDVRVLGWNGRISAFASAVALAQLRRYPEVLSELQANARVVEETVRECRGLELFLEDPRITAQSYTRFGFRVLAEELGIERSLFCEALRAEGIPCHPGTFTPVNRFSFFSSGEWRRWVLRRDDLGAVDENYRRSYPGADRLHEHEAVYLPRNLLLRRADAEATATALRKTCGATAKLRRLPRGSDP